MECILSEHKLHKVIKFEEAIEFQNDFELALSLSKKNEKLFDKIYSFGCNSHGELGIKKEDKIKTPTMISFFGDKKFLSLHSGCSYAIVLTGNQDLNLNFFFFVW